MTTKIDCAQTFALAQQVLEVEANAILALTSRIGQDFIAAVTLLLDCTGKVIVSGIGKSGHIARKLAATLASTGTPAFFVHPAEARHGDLGMITAQDVVIVLSNSGETDELVDIVPWVKRIGAQLISITGKRDSSLAALSDVQLDACVEQEACPLNLAPTASTSAALALGDALAIAVLNARGFSAEDFARVHPGGALGRRLLTYVRDVMHTGQRLPQVNQQASVHDALFEMTEKRLGMTAIVDTDGHIKGIFTDGDLRRVLEKHSDLHALKITAVMTRQPHTIEADQIAAAAIELMEHARINQLLVSDHQGVLIGALNMFDLLDAKII
jgi:arabinose-5-phosphate isomerase